MGTGLRLRGLEVLSVRAAGGHDITARPLSTPEMCFPEPMQADPDDTRRQTENADAENANPKSHANARMHGAAHVA